MVACHSKNKIIFYRFLPALFFINDLGLGDFSHFCIKFHFHLA
ncbi:Uncharacterised protein [Mycobacteroides abscessus subsp. abscessus]|nr:Uncharacterised protein [Mycobacteroides abscessus subsp. abscessus]